MALSLGMTAKNLRDVAMGFHLNYNDLQWSGVQGRSTGKRL